MRSDQLGEPVHILLIEDNPGDVRLTVEALNRGRILNRLSVVHDGVDALDFLYRRGQYIDAPRPHLIFLDLNLPKKSGREVLAEIKQDASLKRIPVVVLTTSNAERDILESYELQANCYVTKPVNLDRFLEVVKSIVEFWIAVVKLPTDASAP